MQPLQLTPEDKSLIKNFNRNVEWLKMQAVKTQPADVWGTYEEAVKILARSKAWYKTKRLGIIKNGILTPALLEKGKDWRTVGNRTDYRLDSIRALKDRISTNN